MKIAYITNYLGKEFQEKYCKNRSFSISATYKCQGLARAMMLAGHDVSIFSSGITTCDVKIKSFSETELYPEGKLEIIYPIIYSFRKFAPLNSIMLRNILKKEHRKNNYDAFVYYNISTDAVLSINIFINKPRVLEYEDNIFNKALVGDKNNFVWLKRKMYNYLLQRTDAAMVVCTGMLTNNEVSLKVLTPGIINEDVTENIDYKHHKLSIGKPVKIFLTGGTHYSKGPDLLIKALKYIKHPCEVHFVGNGSFDSAANSAIKDVPKIHKVTIDGYIEHPDLIKYLTKEADILINTTRNMGVALNSAGFPFKMMEYAAIGRPIVSSQIGKLDEEFNSYITYYDIEDPEAVARAINDVIENYEYKISLSSSLQKLALNKYSIKGVSETISIFLSELQKDVHK